MAPRKRRQHAEFSEAALDALIGDAKTPADLDALFRRMKKALAERILGAELTHHLGYGPGEAKPPEQANTRNGSTPKGRSSPSGKMHTAARGCLSSWPA